MVVFKKYHQFYPASFLLMADSIPQAHAHDHYYAISVWYLEALLKIIVATYCLQALVARYKPNPRGQFRFLALVASTLCIFRLGVPYLMRQTFPNLHSVEVDMVVTNFNFISNMGLFYVGILLSRLMTRKSRLQFLLVGVSYALLCIHDLGVWPSIYFMISLILILYIPRISVPRLISNVVYEVASCSMYIYLSHHYLIDLWAGMFRFLGMAETWVHWTYVPFGVLGGIAVTRIVRYCQCRMNIWFRKPNLPVAAFEEG
jgi:hypothetical protein